jgi:hypothetical protein
MHCSFPIAMLLLHLHKHLTECSSWQTSAVSQICNFVHGIGLQLVPMLKHLYLQSGSWLLRWQDDIENRNCTSVKDSLLVQTFCMNLLYDMHAVYSIDSTNPIHKQCTAFNPYKTFCMTCVLCIQLFQPIQFTSNRENVWQSVPELEIMLGMIFSFLSRMLAKAKNSSHLGWCRNHGTQDLQSVRLYKPSV